MTQTKAQQIAELEAIKASCVEALQNCGRHMVGTEWWTDRIDELARVNRWLVQMGAAPEHIRLG